MSSPQERIEALLAEEEGEAAPAPLDREVEQPVAQPSDRQEEHEPEPAGQDEEPSAQETEVDTEEEEELSITSLSELADHLGVDVADVYGLKVPITKADGTKTEITIGEYKDSYREIEQVKAERQRQESEYTALQQELTAQKRNLDTAYTQVNHMIQSAERQILGDIESPYMRDLRSTDPAEYAAKKDEYRDGLERLKAMRDEAVNSYNQQMQEEMNKREASYKQYLQEQYSDLPNKIKEWKDPSIMAAEQKAIAAYLIEQGVNPEKVNTLSSAVEVSIARKAMLWDKQQASKPEAKRKIVSIGKKVLRSGKAKTKQERHDGDRHADYKRFRDTRSEDAAAAFVEKHLLGDFK